MTDNHILPSRVFGLGKASWITGEERMAEITGESRSSPWSSGTTDWVPRSTSHCKKLELLCKTLAPKCTHLDK